MNDQLGQNQAEHVADFLRSLRGDWDRAGIMAALGTARLRIGATAGDVAIAAIKAATNPKNRTPAVIPLDGDHWREHVRPATTPIPPSFNRTTPAGYHLPPEGWTDQVRATLHEEVG